MKEIVTYFPDITASQHEQFKQLMPLYSFWNARINVISRQDINSLYQHHVLHSLSIARVISFRPGTRIIDAGTGGGFPGIPLAILFPEVLFHLVDSIGKKVKVVDHIARETGLNNVTTEHIRLENVGNQFDFIISRAVTALPEFLGWCDQKIRTGSFNDLDNGILYLKGGDLVQELSMIRQSYRIFPIDSFFHESYFQGKKIIYIPF